MRIIKVGLPAGLQGSAFSVSYLLAPSFINSLGAAVMAAVTGILCYHYTIKNLESESA